MIIFVTWPDHKKLCDVVTFETLITIQTIENLNSWHSLLADNKIVTLDSIRNSCDVLLLIFYKDKPRPSTHLNQSSIDKTEPGNAFARCCEILIKKTIQYILHIAENCLQGAMFIINLGIFHSQMMIVKVQSMQGCNLWEWDYYFN